MIHTRLGWFGIFRLGLVQTALGAIVVLTTSTINRVMVIELALPAMLPGALVGLHYAVQLLRPRLGHGADNGWQRTPWIISGMLVLASSGVAAAIATTWIPDAPLAGIALSILAFIGVGLGVGLAGTTLLVLLAESVEETRRPAAATIVWMMMIAGFVLTAGIAGKMLDPFSLERLVQVAAAVSGIAFTLAVAALWRVEGRHAERGPAHTRTKIPAEQRPEFRKALAEVWAEPRARLFTVFVFVSMLAYSAQDLILEPFAGAIFGYSPGESTQLSGIQNGGVLLGMAWVAIAGSVRCLRTVISPQAWTVVGCIGSALALGSLVLAGNVGPGWPLRISVFALGVANGIFAVSAIASMMTLVDTGAPGRKGVRMGLWGASQAIAFGAGGFIGTVAFDIARAVLDSPLPAYCIVFGAEAVLFVFSARLASEIARSNTGVVERVDASAAVVRPISALAPAGSRQATAGAGAGGG